MVYLSLLFGLLFGKKRWTNIYLHKQSSRGRSDGTYGIGAASRVSLDSYSPRFAWFTLVHFSVHFLGKRGEPIYISTSDRPMVDPITHMESAQLVAYLQISTHPDLRGSLLFTFRCSLFEKWTTIPNRDEKWTVFITLLVFQLWLIREQISNQRSWKYIPKFLPTLIWVVQSVSLLVSE